MCRDGAGPTLQLFMELVFSLLFSESGCRVFLQIVVNLRHGGEQVYLGLLQHGDGTAGGPGEGDGGEVVPPGLTAEAPGQWRPL